MMASSAGTLGRGAGRTPWARPAPSWLAILLALGLLALGADDLRVRRALPRDSPAARAYMAAMVRDDPTAMWANLSAAARQARGDNQAAFVAAMRVGPSPNAGPTNPYALVATVPEAAGLTLLYYRVTLTTDAGPSFLLVPVIINASGAVVEAGDDGLSFVPPKGA